MSKIMMALELLRDGKWHQTEELMLSLNLNKDKIRELTSFFNAYNLAKVDGKNGRVRINSDLKKFLTRIT